MTNKYTLNEIINFLRKNYIIIVLAIVSSLVAIYPQVYFKYKLGGEYKGVYRIINDDEIYYLARGHDVAEGYFKLGNPYIYELKNKPNIQFFVPDFLVTKSLSWTGFSVPSIFFFYDIVFSFVITVLTYILFFTLTKSRFWSISGVVFLIFGMFFYFFNRPISPQFVFIFYLSLSVFLVSFIKTGGHDKKIFYLSMLNFGLLFYFYTYFWTFFSVFIFISGLTFFIFDNKFLAKKFFYILLGGVVLGSYYFLNMFKVSKLLEYKDTLSRLGMINSHFPSGIIILTIGGAIIITFIFLIRLKKVSFNSDNIFVLSGVISGMIVVNQHIITGKNLAFTLHYYLPVLFWFVIAIVYFLSQLNISKYRSIFFLICFYIFITITTKSGNQMLMNLWQYFVHFSEVRQEEVYKQNYSKIFSWLNQNTNKDDVVFANEDLSHYIPAYTNNNVFYCRSANLHFISDEEVFDRFYISNIFYDINREYIIKNSTNIFGVRFVDKYGHDLQENKFRKLFGLKEISTEFLPESAISMVEDVFANLKKENTVDLFKKYRIDYFIWDKNKNPEWRLDKYGFLKKVYDDNNFVIYRFQK